MDRFWLLTWTTYGTWLPGDPRGFVGNVRLADGTQTSHNIPSTPCDADIPGLGEYVREQMNGPAVNLGQSDADAMIAQYQETARIRGWALQAASVMFNHTHVALGVPGDPDPELILTTL
jgi:hypothetical protein